ncbi:MAG: N-acetylmuramoyl-L-alanine amidase [Bacteroidales bacterium]
MKKHILPLSLLITALLPCELTNAQDKVTGLSDWSIFIDQGHSKKENGGLYDYSEAEKTLRVGLALRDYLQNHTDIKQIHMCRLTDQDDVSLEGRTDMANATDADFYYSIHSDAGAPQTNTTLFMYGGWRDNGIVFEKDPKGGQELGDILCSDLTGVMRLKTRGSMADRCYYDNSETHTNKYPYLSVNRRANMASLLSEAGFHTNPEQQQRNLNADYKRLEALSAFRSILEFMKTDRPQMGAVCGVIKDKETGIPVNGATVRIDGKEYTTDTYESLFNKYSKDPDQLHNGFFFIEGLKSEAKLSIEYSSPVYNTITQDITIASAPDGRTADNITWCDLELISNVPPKVTNTEFYANQNHQIKRKPFKIVFSRKMDKASVEDAMSITPAKLFAIEWIDDFSLYIHTDDFDWGQTYTLMIDAQIAKNALTGQLFDGNGDGKSGDNYTLIFTMAAEDNVAPALSDQSIRNEDIVHQTNPVIRFVFNEVLDHNSVTDESIALKNQTGEIIPSTIHHKVVADESVVHVYPLENLTDNQKYTLMITDLITDESGNSFTPENISFTINHQAYTSCRLFDGFETLQSWWQPQQSGSSNALDPDNTSAKITSEIHLNGTDNNNSCKLSYGWDLNASGNPYIRFYIPDNAAQNKIKIDPDDIIEMAVYGDGSNTQMRFMIRDGKNQLEASPWMNIEWKGWKIVSWDLKAQPATGWVNGDGVLDAGKPFFFDGIHMRNQTGSARTGALYFDNLQYVQKSSPVGIENTNKNTECYIYPNPAKDRITVTSSEVINSVTIYNASGSMVFHNTPEAESITINTSAFYNGTYIVKVTTSQDTYVNKLIIK